MAGFRTIVTFKALSNRKIVYKNIPILHDFVELPAEKFMGVELPRISVECQVINYLDEIDKSEIMSKYGFDMIFDYYVRKERKSKKQRLFDEFEDFVNYIKPAIEENPILKRPFEAIILESYDVLFGYKKSNAQKLNEVINSYTMLIKAAEGTLNMLLKKVGKNPDFDKAQVKTIKKINYDSRTDYPTYY